MQISSAVLPLFERDRQLCVCSHVGGQHGHESPSGEFVGIGLGGCQHQPVAAESFHGLDAPCPCAAFRP